jgi:hypothetical protein
VRNHHQRLHAAIEQRLRQLELLRIVPFGGLDEHVGAELLGALQEQIAVARPALLPQRVQEEADLRSRFLFRMRRRLSAGGDEDRENADDENGAVPSHGAPLSH